MSGHLDIVFTAPPGPGRECVFVECECDGRSVTVGEWITRDDGLVALRIPAGITADDDPASTISLMIRNGDPELATHLRKMLRTGEISLDGLR